MSKGGVIVRLIDIVLLLLFGFLAISQIEKKSPISLPESIVKVKSKPEEDELFILGLKRNKKKIDFYVEGEDVHLPTLKSVENKILSRKKTLETEFNRKLKVRIRSNWNLPIKYTMKIVKFCQRKGIKVGLDVETQMK